MSYTDLRDFEEEYTHVDDYGQTFKLEKLGGGTLGKSYAGTWRYLVTDDKGNEIARGQDFETGMPHTHKEAACELATYFDTED